MQRYLMLEVSEGGQESSFESGEAGFVWVVGPLPEELRRTPPIMIKEIREFMRGVYDLNMRLWPEPKINTEPLGIIITSIEGEPGEATPLEEMHEVSSKTVFPEIELYYRVPLGGIC